MKVKSDNQITKKIFLLLTVFLSITATTHAQEFFFYKSFGEYSYDITIYNPFSYYKRMQRPKNLYKELQLKEQKIYCQNFTKDTNTYLYEQKLYDNNGFTIFEKRFSRKGKIEYHNEQKYSDKGWLIMQKYFNKKGKPIYWWENILDEKGRTIETKSYDKNGILTYHTVYLKNEQGKTSESNSYHGKKHKLVTRMVYTYYSNGDKETTTKFNGKGKIEKVWSYACSAEGTERRKMKDTVQICKIADYDKDGGFTITNRTINEEGKLLLLVSKYDKDSICLESALHYSPNKLIYKTTTKKTPDGWLCEYFNSFATNNSENSQLKKMTYNNQKILIKSENTTISKNGKIKSKNIATYNDEDKYDKIVYYQKGGEKIDKSAIYNYTDKGLLQEVTVFNENGIIQNKTMYQYQ